MRGSEEREQLVREVARFPAPIPVRDLPGSNYSFRGMRDEPTIAVWGHYHGGNLGDELVVATLIEAIRKHVPGASVVGISMAPTDTRARHGIDAYPINPGSAGARPSAPPLTGQGPGGRVRSLARHVPGARQARTLAVGVRKALREVPFLWRSYRLLRRVDLVVAAGSGQLLDEWRGPWLHPYTIFRWGMLARAARVPLLLPAMGAGPIESRLSAFFIRHAVNAADYVSVRDRHSRQVLSAIGSKGPFPVSPDMGYGLSEEILRAATATAPATRDGTIVGLNVMAHQDPRYWPRGDARRYEVFLRKMAAFTHWLLDNGYTVRLFSSQARSDGRVADDLVTALAESAPRDPARLQSMLGSIHQVEDLVSVVAGCDCVVAARYHSVLLPLLLDIPVLGLAYHPKTVELLADVDQADRCLDIDEFTVESLIASFRGLVEPEEPATSIDRRMRVAEHQAAVEAQFQQMFDGLGERRSLEASNAR